MRWATGVLRVGTDCLIPKSQSMIQIAMHWCCILDFDWGLCQEWTQRSSWLIAMWGSGRFESNQNHKRIDYRDPLLKISVENVQSQILPVPERTQEKSGMQLRNSSEACCKALARPFLHAARLAIPQDPGKTYYFVLQNLHKTLPSLKWVWNDADMALTWLETNLKGV